MQLIGGQEQTDRSQGHLPPPPKPTLAQTQAQFKSNIR
jgi:hypothetical protein